MFPGEEAFRVGTALKGFGAGFNVSRMHEFPFMQQIRRFVSRSEALSRSYDVGLKISPVEKVPVTGWFQSRLYK
jgi:hypothetical protein